MRGGRDSNPIDLRFLESVMGKVVVFALIFESFRYLELLFCSFSFSLVS